MPLVRPRTWEHLIAFSRQMHLNKVYAALRVGTGQATRCCGTASVQMSVTAGLLEASSKKQWFAMKLIRLHSMTARADAQ